MEGQSHEDWFLSLDSKQMAELSRKWLSANILTDLPELDNYDDWLNYFKKIPPLKIQELARVGQGILSTEAYAALTRWADILKSPHRIDKIYQAGLTRTKDGERKSITELAQANDKLGVLYVIRDQIAEKLERGTGARDTANLAREMSEILDQISEEERRQGPKKNTVLAGLLADKPKRAKGARNGSFKAHMIAEIENGEA